MFIKCASCKMSFDSTTESVCPGCGLAAAVPVAPGSADAPVALRSAVPVGADELADEPPVPEPVFLGAPRSASAEGEPKVLRPKRAGGRVLLWLAVLVLLGAGGGVGAIVWYKTRPNVIKPEGAGFTVTLPAGKLKTETHRAHDGEVVGQSLSVESTDGKYTVEHDPAPEHKSDIPDSEFATFLIQLTISTKIEKRLGYIVTHQEKVEVEGAVVAFHFEAVKGPTTLIARFIWLPKRMVILRVEGERLKPDSPAVTAFFDSFAVVE